MIDIFGTKKYEIEALKRQIRDAQRLIEKALREQAGLLTRINSILEVDNEDQ